jgi:hypothetical protein
MSGWADLQRNFTLKYPLLQRSKTRMIPWRNRSQ